MSTQQRTRTGKDQKAEVDDKGSNSVHG
jgi:hypothetical protein